ncbi:MAG TPA: DUF1549 domain-containing protein [Candidatus Saccharimonadia bacterium]|nr:DUF1549 domain-containing protein [Candidatus Saccharimonadia bacterium]
MRISLLLAACLGIPMAYGALPTGQAPAAMPATGLDPAMAEIRVRAEAIDTAVEALFAKHALLAKHHFPIPPAADDSIFLRRVHLGITGQIPTATQAAQFFADTNPNKRAALIDRLIDSPEASEHLFQQLSEMLHLQDEALGASQQRFFDWVRESLRSNMPYDAFVRSMITAKGTLEENPAVGWLLGGEGSVMPATMDLCTVWLGYNMQCATCHDSPFNDATQMEFYKLAANFSAVRTVQRTADGKEHFVGATLPLQPAATLAVREERLMHLRLPKDYAYRDGQPGDVVVPRLPQLNRMGRNGIWHPVPPPWPLKSKPPLPAPKNMRETLARWVTVDNEARFSHVIASRLWIRMLGEGRAYALDAEDLRHPLPLPSLNAMMPMLDRGAAGAWGSRCHAGPSSYDGMRAVGCRTFSIEAEELSDPVMSVLAAVMRDVSFDLREFQRVIWNTRAAQREATPDVWGVVTEAKFTTVGGGASASPIMRRMSAEQIWDALVSLAGPNTTEKPSRVLPQVLDEGHPLRALGRSARGWSDEDRAPLSPTLARWMMHSPLVLAVASPGSRVLREMEAAKDKSARIRLAFLSTLSRPALPKEEARALELYRSMDTVSADGALVWTLLNTSEFIFLH